MLEIISHTPFYVWGFLVYLIWGGWKSTKTYLISWKALLPMPAVMFLASAYMTASQHGTLSLGLWGASIALGIWLGSLTVRGLSLRFDKERHLIEIGGHWTPLLLSLSIFSLRYFLGVSYGMHPELAGSPTLLWVENLATVVSGMLTGRLWGYWKRWKASLHVDLAPINLSR